MCAADSRDGIPQDTGSDEYDYTYTTQDYLAGSGDGKDAIVYVSGNTPRDVANKVRDLLQNAPAGEAAGKDYSEAWKKFSSESKDFSYEQLVQTLDLLAADGAITMVDENISKETDANRYNRLKAAVETVRTGHATISLSTVGTTKLAVGQFVGNSKTGFCENFLLNKFHERGEILRYALFNLGKASFGHPWAPNGGFDGNYWKEGEKKLILKPDCSAAEATNEIVEHAKRWSFDCAEFVYIATLYVEKEFLGKDLFDQNKINNPVIIQPQIKDLPLPGLPYYCVYYVDYVLKKVILKGGDYTKKEFRELARLDIELESIIDQIPNGARIVFKDTTFKDTKDPFHAENTIKTGKDRYAGFVGSVETKTAQEWGTFLGKKLGVAPEDIKISEIQINDIALSSSVKRSLPYFI